MDWARAIDINQAALARILAALLAALGLAPGASPARLPKPLYVAALWVVRPLEAAVRRLIVIAARGLKVTLPPPWPMPKGLVVIAGKKASGRHAFQLFDPRKRFAVQDLEKPPVKAEPVERGVLKPEDDTVSATCLGQRLAALKRALENLPAQAKRLARWKARRARMQSPKLRSPLRPGPPLGHRRKPQEELDFVLTECHGLAWDALREDTS